MSDEDKTKDKRRGKVVPLNKLAVLSSIMQSREWIAGQLGKSFSGQRDLYVALGYKRELTFEDYWARYSRQDIAKRIVEALPNATWRRPPAVVETKNDQDETDFEKAWKTLVKDHAIWHHINRVDILSGIGQYGVLLMGFEGDLHQPVSRARELLYLRPFHQGNAKPKAWVKNRFSRRFGLPESYELQLRNVEVEGVSSKTVHHSRVLHVAEGLLQDDIYGTPRLQAVFNRLQDLELVSGGSAEMFWRGAFPGLGIKTEKDSGFEWTDDEKDSLEEELEAYIHGLQRYLRLEGLDIKELAQQVADPSKHVGVLLDLVAGATGIPKRILIGSERGELASSQDETA
jgi:hypothetical protein